MVQSPLKKTSRKSKWCGEDARGASQQKRMKLSASSSSLHTTDLGPGTAQPRRSSRAGAGVGGHVLQLERVSAMIEGLQHESRPMTTLPHNIGPNPVAPHSNNKSRKKVNVYFILQKLVLSKGLFPRNNLKLPHLPTSLLPLMLPRWLNPVVGSIKFIRSVLHLCLNFTLGQLVTVLVSMSRPMLFPQEQSPTFKL